MSLNPHRRWKHDEDLCDALGLNSTCSDHDLARAIQQAAGMYPVDPFLSYEPQTLSLSSHAMFSVLAEELGVVLWELKPVHVNARAKRIAGEVVRNVQACDAAGALLALAPGRHLPRGSVLDLHRASRAVLFGVVTEVAYRILRLWADYGIIAEVLDSDAA